MTIQEAITKIDNLKPNAYKQPQKLDWLSAVDGRVFYEILGNGKDSEWKQYSDDTDVSTKLLIPDPYSDLYIYYMGAMVDYWNGEFTKYNNAMVQFNEAFESYGKEYSRTNLKSGSSRFRL